MILPQNEFNAIFSDRGFDISDARYEKFRICAEMLVERNSRVNLTKITDPYGITVKHFLDSLLILRYADIPRNAALIDVGTGAGFPGIPLKIYREDISITLLDSQSKRVEFQKAVSDKLGLDADCIHARAEDGGHNKKLRESFDTATARAVAALPVLCEYCLPFLRVGGVLIAMKTPNEDFKPAETAVKLLGGELSDVADYKLPDGDARRLFVIAKKSPAPEKYPRNAGQIAKKPL